ncbi:YncE family protein [Spirosoma rhododendri]|uniref:SMP-30/gluconolactonase/LRE family protein n=1 Tax=Spirosoma rhododendri TaxID=2728024 RepID=A0A7L5DGV0_9BACT|nr:DUF5074 domain-containing protein [Spirosoma rhododendri]QJD77195.1 SMP-30/gluconolactonase/LRE family protein [Spirosoma rhododendri]
MNKHITTGIVASVLTLSLWNCKTTDPEASPYESGAYIANQGNFSQNNGSVTYIPTGSNTAQTSIFATANSGLTISGGVQDITDVNGKMLILVDNTAAGQDKVEIVEDGTFKSRATLKTPDIENPRRVIYAAPNKAYVSCWDVSGSFSAGTFYKDPGYVAVVDVNSGTVTKKISAVKGAEGMVLVGSEVFVGSAGYSGGNALAIININTDEVVQKVDMGGEAEPIAVDANGKLWVLVGQTMICYNAGARTVEKRVPLNATPTGVAISRDKKSFYFSTSNRTYRFAITDTSVPTTAVQNRSFSAIGIDPNSGTFYGSQNPVSYSQAGYVIRYQESGALIDSVRAEIAPSRFFFR